MPVWSKWGPMHSGICALEMPEETEREFNMSEVNFIVMGRQFKTLDGNNHTVIINMAANQATQILAAMTYFQWSPAATP